MPYKPAKLQNTPTQDAYGNPFHPTIVITEEDSLWKEAFESWKNGKNPTNSKEWKKGVFLIFAEKKDEI